MFKECLYCHKEFKPDRKERKYCSIICRNESYKGRSSHMLGKKHNPITIQRMKQAKLNNPTKYWLGKTKSYEIRKKMSDYWRPRRKEETNNYKGDKAKYSAKHMWVLYNFKRPSYCEFCGISTAKRYEWANISGEYRREREDWYNLCKSCHQKFDGVGYKSWKKRKGVFGL